MLNAKSQKLKTKSQKLMLKAKAKSKRWRQINLTFVAYAAHRYHSSNGNPGGSRCNCCYPTFGPRSHFHGFCPILFRFWKNPVQTEITYRPSWPDQGWRKNY